ncbi:MAG TPA: glycosyltransferase family 1 protein [Microthrixaceae bacterium]|nr:glycosyltransferase family 1 protein [Microthrixaceae bacterium]
MTRVLVNLLWLVPGVVGGSEESTTDALRAVADVLDRDGSGGDFDIHLAVLEQFAHAHPDLAERYDLVVADQDGRDKRRRVWAEQTWLAARTRALRPQVVHHAGGVVPFVHPGRTVLTVHDLQPLDLPHNFRPAKRNYIRLMAARSARAADIVTVPSRFTRERVIERLRVAPARVEVVPWWVAPPRRQDTSELFPLPPTLGGDRFVLYPAITYPHKRHDVLLDAFALIAARHPRLRLVLTGGAAASESAVQTRIRRPDLDGRVLRTGRVPAAQLESLFAAAALVAVPSDYEGFGLPVLEAMVRGVPVVAAAAGSLPEVARPEDLVPAEDVAAWAAAIEAVLAESTDARTARIAGGRERAAQFGPERTAAALLTAYRRAAAARVPT